VVPEPSGAHPVFLTRPSVNGGHRLYTSGYRYLENSMDKVADVKNDAVVSKPRQVSLGRRPVVQISLGPVVVGAVRPHPDPLDPDTTIAGVKHRFLRKPPTPEDVLLKKFRLHCRRQVRKEFVPLSSDADVSVERWLSHTDYPDWRRQELRVQWDGVASMWDPDKSHRYFRCSSFMKDEDYPTYKHARAINSRSDAFKCAVGPVFKLIEEQVYQHKAFIKHVPVADRPDYIMSYLHREGAKYVATDYTAFESLFVRKLMDACEFELYSYMTQHLPYGGEFMRLVREVLGGRNLCVFKDFKVMVDATRMSGEMCTSLGNGFSNLMLMQFVCAEAGCREVLGVVEGDDGLFTMVGTPPTAADFARLGLIIKMEVHDTISTASFCGIVFDPSERINVTDPRKVLVNFGWAQRAYGRARTCKLTALLRCKALSILFQYPGCPIIAELGRYGARVTPHQKVRMRRLIAQKGFYDLYTRQKIEAAMQGGNIPHKVPGMNTRLLVEKLYGITVEVQLSIESYLRSLKTIQPLDHWSFPMIIPALWYEHGARYSFASDRLDVNLEIPAQCYLPAAGLCREWNDEDMPEGLSNRRAWSTPEQLHGISAQPIRPDQYLPKKKHLGETGSS